MNEAAEFGPAALWLTGALSSVFSIIVSTGVSEFVRRRSEQRLALQFLLQNLQRSRRGLEMWKNRPSAPHWNHRGPMLPAFDAVDVLGPSLASLPPKVVRLVQDIGMLTPMLAENFALLQARYDQLRELHAHHSSTEKAAAECIQQWDHLVGQSLPAFLETEQEVERELTRLNRRVWLAPL